MNNMTGLAKYFISQFVFIAVPAATNHISAQVPEKGQNRQPLQIVVGSVPDYPPYCIVTIESNASPFQTSPCIGEEYGTPAKSTKGQLFILPYQIT